ncbi:MAG: SDR family oxidoreductase [Acidobacteriota bacterium]|nr:SDR family oxidoreductase [Acidobacteriota bacterium]
MAESRVAFVTGGAGGIGGEICRQLAAAGCRVAVADLPGSSAGEVAAEIDGLAVELDLVDPASIEAAVARTAAELGPVGICVNCAGWDELKPFLDTDDTFLERILAINLAGPMRVTRAVLPGMVEARWGRIISIASDAGRVGSSLEAIYSGAKGGMIAFTKTVAREMARYGITSNAVCPGPTDTPLLQGIVDASGSGDKVIHAMVRGVPMRRLGKPADVAPAVAFLASEEAGYITGQTLSVSGGLTMS